MHKHNNLKRILALFLALALCVGFMPSVLAAQDSAYHDPAEHWVQASNRTSELDSNAIVTHETFNCCICNKVTSFLIFRTPEYTRDGMSAMTRNVFYSDGASLAGEIVSRIYDGVPGVDAFYTGNHWTKAICETCGTINSNQGLSYGLGQDIYLLSDCAASFMQDLGETVEYEAADDQRHAKTVKGGQYCVFCFGTNHTERSTLERHDINATVTAEAGNHRFKTEGVCSDCGYDATDYLAAKAVITNYYGVADGKAHTLTVTDLSDSGVSTAIRYGKSADSCTMTSAPNYTEEGQYTVYYKITYTCGDKSMDENGVAYVQLRGQEEDPPANLHACDTHNFALVSSVTPTCTSLGYDRYLCPLCGMTENRNYTAALGHNWQNVIVREATCGTDGEVAEICSNCGQVKTFSVPAAEHAYNLLSVPATCTSSGYEAEECSLCGVRHVLGVTNATAHNYIATTTPATCTTSGRTTYRCSTCGDSYTDNYMEPLGHNFDIGTVITAPTCTTDGVKEYRCGRCAVTALEAIPATGHTPSGSANCGQPDICANCGAALNAAALNATAHNYIATTTPATCTTGGRTTYRCSDCGDSYTDNYTEPLGHTWDLGTVITPATCTTEGVKEYRCGRCAATTLEAVPATGHTPGDPANCDQPQTCAKCGAVLCSSNGHHYKDIVTPATCETGGNTTRRCEDCGESYITSYTEALGHAWDEGTVLAAVTCTGDGITEYNCTRCEAHYLETTPASGHVPGPEATCTQAQVCAKCGTVLAVAHGHDYKATVTPATCTEKGYTTIACVACGKSYVTDHTAALGHAWGEGKTVTVPTCGGEGVTEYRCTRCDYHRTEAQSATGHTPGAAATCTRPQLCVKCGSVLAEALGHDYQPAVTAPTCEKMGFTTYTCSRCADGYKSDYTEATGHKAGEWIVDKAATTASQGNRHQECVTCKKVLSTEAIEKVYLLATTNAHGEAVVGGWLVTVTDTSTRNPISGAEVELDKDSALSVRLPSKRLLDYDEQTTITVQTVADKAAVPGVAVAVTDKNDNAANGSTSGNGAVTVPGTADATNADGNTTVGYTDADRDRWTLTVKVADFETNRPIVGSAVSIGKTGSITVVLPKKVDMDEDNRITVTVTDNKGDPQEGQTVTVKSDLGQKEQGQTDQDGKLTVPPIPVDAVKHGAYVVGYDNGNFGPEDNMTRAEAAVIFGRLLADNKGESAYPAAYSKYKDVEAGSWYAPYVRYLSTYGVVYGCGNSTFDPDRVISRAEFVTMAVRFFNVYDGGNAAIQDQYASFDDVTEGSWAAEYIRDAAAYGWVNGYGDGLFHGSDAITRAEAVTVINRLLDREADRGYIAATNNRRLVTFPDVGRRHWAYYDIMEAANGHIATLTDNGESWSK